MKKYMLILTAIVALSNTACRKIETDGQIQVVTINTGGGGGLYVGFATTVTNSSFNTNQASNGFGGGVLGHGRISIITSSLTGNQAMNGGGAAIDYFSDQYQR